MKRACLALIAGSLVTAALAPGAAAASTGRIVMTGLGTTSGVFSMLPDGTDLQKLHTIAQGWGVGSLDAADDGSMIAMTFLPRNKGHIYAMDATGAGFAKVTSGGDDSDPSFSPDASAIAFVRYGSRSDLYRVDSDGTNLTRLTQTGEPQASFPSWSPDGNHIAFFRIGRKHQALVLTDPTGMTFDTILRANRRSGQFFTLNWSPDSSTLIFSKYDREFINADLYSVAADGTGLTRLTKSAKVAEVSPSYSPDGTKIACSAQDPYGRWADVVTFDADGSNRNRIVLPRDQYHVSWGG